MRRRIDLDVDAPVALDLIDRTSCRRNDTWTTIAAAQADVSDAANLYPGGHAARCIPAPIFGCVCSIDPSGEAVMFADLDSMADHHFKDDLADSEHSRMISWLRRTCESLTQPATYQQHHFIHSPRWAYHHRKQGETPVSEGQLLEMTTYDLFLCWIIVVLLVLVVGEASMIKLGVNQIYMAAQ